MTAPAAEDAALPGSLARRAMLDHGVKLSHTDLTRGLVDFERPR